MWAHNATHRSALLVKLTFGTRGRHALTCSLDWYYFYQSIQDWWLRWHRFFFVCWLASHHTALALWWSAPAAREAGKLGRALSLGNRFTSAFEFGGSEGTVFVRSCGLTTPHTAQPCWWSSPSVREAGRAAQEPSAQAPTSAHAAIGP
jgi:hypothetical protein